MKKTTQSIDVSKITLREMERTLIADDVDASFVEACRADSRKAAQQLVRRYERKQAERARVAALYKYEDAAAAEGFMYVAGVDEAGRGPLAGPVSVAAVILPRDLYLPKLNDSKKISAKIREELFEEIQAKAIAIGSALIDAKTIDRINIYQATINGMYESIFSLSPRPQKVLIDAVKLDRLSIPSESIIKGDAESASIAAASIVAKVTRDRLMDAYDRQYPEYGFARHKGYGTAEHLAALKKYGPCPIHRLSFEPIHSMYPIEIAD